jgi:hypothetical protein
MDIKESNMIKNRWVKHTLTNSFVSESCCFLDIDGDGEVELIAGDSWWKLDGSKIRKKFRDVVPDWLPEWPYKDRKDPHAHLRKGGGTPNYRNSTYDWAVDLTGTGIPDVIWVGMHKDPIVWCENSYDSEGNWPIHTITDGGIYESVIYTDILKDGRPSLVTVPRKPWVAWYEPPDDPRKRWIEHIIGFEGGDWHGLGAGDLDGDGKVEVITKDGYYYYEDDPRKPWSFKRIKQITEDGKCINGLGDVFIIEVMDLTSNGIPDLISASPHNYGLWWWELIEDTNKERVYRRHTLNNSVSQLHSIKIFKRNYRDNSLSIVCGKRWHAHGPYNDVDPNGPALLMAFSPKELSWTDTLCEIIDDDSGVGIKFDTGMDSKGNCYIAVSNKKGVHFFTQK